MHDFFLFCFVFLKSFPQDNAGHSVFPRKPRNLSVGSNNNIEEENKVIRAAVLGKDGVGKTGEWRAFHVLY